MRSRLTRGPTAPALEVPPSGRVPLVQRIATVSRERPAPRSLILSEPGILTAQRAGTTATTLRVACEDPAHVAAGGASSSIAISAPIRPGRPGIRPLPSVRRRAAPNYAPASDGGQGRCRAGLEEDRGGHRRRIGAGADVLAGRDTPVHGHVDIGVQRGGRLDERLAAAGAVAPDRRPRRVLVQVVVERLRTLPHLSRSEARRAALVEVYRDRRWLRDGAPEADASGGVVGRGGEDVVRAEVDRGGADGTGGLGGERNQRTDRRQRDRDEPRDGHGVSFHRAMQRTVPTSTIEAVEAGVSRVKRHDPSL